MVKRYTGSFDRGTMEINLSALLAGECRRLGKQNYYYTLVRRRRAVLRPRSS